MAYKVDTKRKTIQAKIQKIDQTLKEMKKYKSVSLLDLRKLPDALLQRIRRDLRGDTKVLVLKKAVLSRILEKEPGLVKYAGECDKPMALLLSNRSPYELNRFFKSNKKKRAAKVGDVPAEDLVVPAGDTDLPPGPALSELKAAGLNVQIKAGKISVIKDSTVAKAGEELTMPKVKALQTLGVMPFEVMANYIMGYDGKLCFTSDVLDLGDTVNEDLAAGLGQAMNLSLNSGFPSPQSIDLLLGGAMRQAMDLSINSGTYSSSSIEQLLVSAMRQGSALTGLESK